MCLAFSLKLQNEQLRMMAEVAGSFVLSRKLGGKCPVTAPLLTQGPYTASGQLPVCSPSQRGQ